MGNVFHLLKLQIDNKTNLLKTFAPKKMAVAICKTLAVLLAVLFAVRFVGSKIFVLGISINAQLLAVILAITQLISVVFCTGNIIGTLYFGKDNEMLICLPVTPNQLFVSKILFIYLRELYVSSLISIPIFMGLGIMGGLPTEYYFSFLFILFFLPVLPIVLASFLSVLIMAVHKYLKKHPYLSVILMLLLVIACLAGYVYLIGNIVTSFNIAGNQIETVKKINADISRIGSKIFLYYQLALAFLSFGNWRYFLLFVAVCLVLFFITLLVIRKFYFKASQPERQSGTVRGKERFSFRCRSPFISLIAKEILCVFRSPDQVFGYFLFTLLMPFIVYSYDKLFMSITVNQTGVNMIAGAHIMAVAILAMLSNLASASAISRDGSEFYISKIIPVNYFTQMFAKLAFNVLFTLGALFVTMIVSCFIYPIWQIVIGTVAVAFFSVGHAAMSLEMDVRDPAIPSQGNGDVPSAGKNTTKSIISALFIGVAIGAFIIFTSSMQNVAVPYIILSVLGLVFMLHRLVLLVLRINLQYEKIEM